MKNYYEILGISKDASPEDIKVAYREALKEHADIFNSPHTDKTDPRYKRLVEINEAGQILCDPKKREAYDRGESEPFHSNAHESRDHFSFYEHLRREYERMRQEEKRRREEAIKNAEKAFAEAFRDSGLSPENFVNVTLEELKKITAAQKRQIYTAEVAEEVINALSEGTAAFKKLLRDPSYQQHGIQILTFQTVRGDNPLCFAAEYGHLASVVEVFGNSQEKFTFEQLKNIRRRRGFSSSDPTFANAIQIVADQEIRPYAYPGPRCLFPQPHLELQKLNQLLYPEESITFDRFMSLSDETSREPLIIHVMRNTTDDRNLRDYFLTSMSIEGTPPFSDYFLGMRIRDLQGNSLIQCIAERDKEEEENYERRKYVAKYRDNPEALLKTKPKKNLTAVLDPKHWSSREGCESLIKILTWLKKHDFEDLIEYKDYTGEKAANAILKEALKQGKKNSKRPFVRLPHHFDGSLGGIMYLNRHSQTSRSR